MLRQVWVLASCVCVCGGAVQGAQASGAVTFRATSTRVLEGTDARVEVRIDNSVGTVYGWSYGLCFDAEYLAPKVVESLPDVLQVKAGAPADWDMVDVGDNGITRGIIVDMFVGTGMPVRTDFRDLGVTFGTAVLGGTDSDVQDVPVRPCHEEAGMPPTRAVWTDGGGNSTLAQLSPGTVSVHKVVSAFTFRPRAAVRAPVDAVTGEPTGAAHASVMLRQIDDPFFPLPEAAPVEAFVLSVAYDPAAIRVGAVRPGMGLESLRGGAGPDYFEAHVDASCFYAACTASMAAPWEYLAALSGPIEIARIDLGIPAGVYAGLEEAVEVVLPFSDGCTSAAIFNRVVVAGEPLIPRGLDSAPVVVQVDPQRRHPFIRGDANGDGRLDIGDAIWLLDELFRGGRHGTCEWAKDVNGDGELDISDIVYLLGYVLQHTNGPPPAPFPECGVLEAQEERHCASYPPCAQ